MLDNDAYKKYIEEQKKREEELEKNMNYGNINDGIDNNNDKEYSTGESRLGKVEIKRDDLPPSDMLLGYHNLNIELLPSRGYFYPNNLKIAIRAAEVQEIKHWSTIDENNLLDIEEKLNYIIQKCVRITCENNLYKFIWKDLLEEDRIYLLFAIRDLTFKKNENDIKIKVICQDCNTEQDVIINNNIWEYNDFVNDELLMKYYDYELKLFKVRTASYGDILLKPPSIGVMQAILNYIKEKKEKNASYDEGFIQLAPYYLIDWRGLNNKKLFDEEVEFKKWDRKKFELIYNFCQHIKVGVKNNVLVQCHSCGADVRADLNFFREYSIKRIFIPDISNIAGELL